MEVEVARKTTLDFFFFGDLLLLFFLCGDFFLGGAIFFDINDDKKNCTHSCEKNILVIS